MRTISIVIPAVPPCLSSLTGFFLEHDCVSRVFLVHQDSDLTSVEDRHRNNGKVEFISADSWISTGLLMRLLRCAAAEGLLFILPGANPGFERRGLEEMMALAGITGAGLLYSDYRQITGTRIIDRPMLDYQPGSIRETFDFGPAFLLSVGSAIRAIEEYGPPSKCLRWCAFYDLRLKLSLKSPIVHAPEPLYVDYAVAAESRVVQPWIAPRSSGEYQDEVDEAVTAHLRRIGAYLTSGLQPPPPRGDFPVTASVVIPTRNRARTLATAIESTLKQSTSFPYNILVVDDYSTDGSAEIIRDFAALYPKVVHVLPRSRSLGVGGLWNCAIHSPQCGVYAVQLDSDDVYAHEHAVEMLVNEFTAPDSVNAARAPRHAMVVGSYTFVNFALQQIPPGVNRRLKLSRENGRNNLLCMDGTGAPRAFYVPVLREIGFPDVSVAEDYAVALRISRHYTIGRVFEPLYLARQWEENSVRTVLLGCAKSITMKEILPPGLTQEQLLEQMHPIITSLGIATTNRNNAFRDYLRTIELQARTATCGKGRQRWSPKIMPGT